MAAFMCSNLKLFYGISKIQGYLPDKYKVISGFFHSFVGEIEKQS